MNKLSPAEEQVQLFEEWMADPKSDDSKLQEFYNSDRVRSLSYLEKNRGFLTGSKLETFRKDEWWYYLQFVEEMPMPYEKDTVYEPFAIGSAFDDLVTYGEQELEKNYIEMERRVSDINEAISECNEKISASQEMLNKDGSRSKVGINQEAAAKAKIEMLMSIVGKTQLTPANMELIRQMEHEWNEQQLFDHKLKKKHIFFKLHGEIPVKCELDHHIPHFTNEHVGAHDFFAVVDAKTCADIEKSVKHARENYQEQMSLYALAAELTLLKESEVDQQVCAIIQAVDKHGLWSRSAAIYFSPELLRDARSSLIERIEKCWRAHRTGMFFKTNEFLPDCPYYGVDNYGRAKNFFIA